ncbi:MAG: hypothetical protein IJ354_06605 [Clostridia bacterium]|nr:hypothetical protein [Clostridia bacterium]
MQASAEQVQWIPIDEITQADENADAGDVVQVIRRADGGYTLLSGGDRLRRMREAGQLCVDALLNPSVRMEERISRLLDRLVRGTIHYLDEAESYRELLDSGICSVQQLSDRIGRTPQTVRRKLRLMELGEDVRELLRRHALCEAYAHQLLRLPGQQGRARVIRHVTEGGLSVKETEKLVDDVLSRMPVPVTGQRRMKPVMRDYRLYLNAIRGIVEQMEEAGLEAHMQVNVGRYVAEARITVPVFANRER